MKNSLVAILYTGLVALANPAFADVTSAAALRQGDMKKLNFHAEPQTAGTSGFVTIDGEPLYLADFKGKWVLVNFWATWCAPCRKEMPTLSELQSELGGESFEVLTIATGRNPPPAIANFFEKIGISNLPQNRDPKSVLAREMGVLGLPITVILNPEGQEVGRLQGDANWSSENAIAVLRALMEPAES